MYVYEKLNKKFYRGKAEIEDLYGTPRKKKSREVVIY